MKERITKKVIYTSYKDKYDETIKTQMETSPESIDVETMRANLYGYTFTKEYTEGVIPNELSMDYWENKCLEDDHELYESLEIEDMLNEIDFDDDYFDVTPQERLILETIDSTGDGKTPETALCVIDVHQEYEYINRVVRFTGLQLIKQSVANGIDCLQFKDIGGDIEKVYFDISRRFDVGYLGKYSTAGAPET